MRSLVKQVISDLKDKTDKQTTVMMLMINLVTHDVIKLQNLNLKSYNLNFLGVVNVFENKLFGRFPGFETAFSITSTDHSKSNINIQLLIHTYS